MWSGKFHEVLSHCKTPASHNIKLCVCVRKVQGRVPWLYRVLSQEISATHKGQFLPAFLPVCNDIWAMLMTYASSSFVFPPALRSSPCLTTSLHVCSWSALCCFWQSQGAPPLSWIRTPRGRWLQGAGWCSPAPISFWHSKATCCMASFLVGVVCKKKRKEKRKDCAFRRQFNEKPSIIPGCPEALSDTCHMHISCAL